MNSSQRKRWFGLLLVLIICLISSSSTFQQIVSLPNELRLFTGQLKQLQYGVPVQAEATVNPQVLKINGSTAQIVSVNLKNPLALQPTQSGQTKLQMKLFGKIPFKTINVNVMPELKVIPGGQTIGVKVKSAGVLVVGHHQIADNAGNKLSPGEQAGLKLGDLITSINGVKVTEVQQVAELLRQRSSNEKPLQIVYKRNGVLKETVLAPTFDSFDKSWRLGLYIRDTAAGVGTLTFYDPTKGRYGALGHVITDMDTQTPVEVGEGKILQSNVTSINKSQTGEPGEKRAQFVREDQVLGNVERNTAFGIFGKMHSAPAEGYSLQPVPIAFSEEVKVGPAEIWTVVSGQKVEKFHIEVTHVAKQHAPATKGMIIKITDKRLLEKTGGIVQGMSGSPILQNGKLIGAVTHVFVNDPSSGYGCYIEWMLQDANVIKRTIPTNHFVEDNNQQPLSLAI